MTTIAHLTDLHILGDDTHGRDAWSGFRLRFLSAGRPLDAAERRQRLLRGLATARRLDVDHIVITGDLTEEGTDAQFEALAEVLSESGIDPQNLTLVPGNHDAYHDPLAWDRALEGPLRAFAVTSGVGAKTVLDEAVIVPVSTAIAQHYARAAGWADENDLDVAERTARDTGLRERAVVVAQHHPPVASALPVWQWINDLQNHRVVRGLLAEHASMHVLCGHSHKRNDWALPGEERERIFCGDAVVEDDLAIRLYEAGDGCLWPLPDPVAAPNAIPVEASPSLAPAYGL